MNSVLLRTAILWIHLLAGAGWMGACACFVLAAGALGVEDQEGRAFVRRVAPKINRIGIAAALTIVATGVVNLLLAASARVSQFSSAFLEVLGAKIAIFLVMFVLLTLSLRAQVKLEARFEDISRSSATRVLFLNGGVVMLGAIAMVLGLWLSGS